MLGICQQLVHPVQLHYYIANGFKDLVIRNREVGDAPNKRTRHFHDLAFDGKDVSRLAAHNKADMGMVLVPEGRQLFTDMTVFENLEMGASNPRARSKLSANLERVYAMFPRLKERAAQRAGTLSGGEQQMLAVARGIMGDPIVLMIDELSLGLAPVLVLNLFESLRQLRQLGITILLVEQNVQMALAICDYGYVLAEGKVQIEGPGRELVKNEQIRVAYLGL